MVNNTAYDATPVLNGDYGRPRCLDTVGMDAAINLWILAEYPGIVRLAVYGILKAYGRFEGGR